MLVKLSFKFSSGGRYSNLWEYFFLKIARGVVAGVDTGIILSAKQCVEFGSHAIGKSYYYQAIDWMEVALAKIAKGNDTTVALTEADIQLETAKKVASPAKRFAN